MPTRRRTRRRRAAGLLAVTVVVAGAGTQLSSPSSSTTAAPVREHRPVPGPPAGTSTSGALGTSDGAVPDGTTVFDGGLPGVANLDPALVAALRRATVAAAGEGVRLLVDSGWRSRRYQRRLLDEAVRKYGSEAQAARWVATPGRSAHVAGDAVDVGPAGAATWLSEHGAEHGLCQVYGNEPWHYELRPQAGVQGCPPLYADPTHDPRMQQ